MAIPFNAYISSEGGTLIRPVFLYENTTWSQNWLIPVREKFFGEYMDQYKFINALFEHGKMNKCTDW